MTFFPRLHHGARGLPALLAPRWPRATGLTSYLSGCLSLKSQRCRFCGIADVLEGIANRAATRFLPGPGGSLCPPFGRFGSAGLISEIRQSAPSRAGTQ